MIDGGGDDGLGGRDNFWSSLYDFGGAYDNGEFKGEGGYGYLFWQWQASFLFSFGCFSS